MAKKKVFISFDFDNDREIRDLMIAQGKLQATPWEISDYSLKEAAPQKDWQAKAHRAIARSDVFIIMLGRRTRVASGVLKEVAMANELGKTRFQIIGRKGGGVEWAVQGGGRTYAWKWETIGKLIG